MIDKEKSLSSIRIVCRLSSVISMVFVRIICAIFPSLHLILSPSASEEAEVLTELLNEKELRDEQEDEVIDGMKISERIILYLLDAEQLPAKLRRHRVLKVRLFKIFLHRHKASSIIAGDPYGCWKNTAQA